MAAAKSVAEILNAAQDSRSDAALARCAGQLWKLLLQDPDTHYQELLECVRLLLTASQKSPHVQHCTRFFGSFASKAPTVSEAATAVVEALLEHLAELTAAADKDVRHHACQLLHQVLAQLPAELLQDDTTVLDTLTEALTVRLQDKLPTIRAEAVRGLCDLISFFEDTEDIVEALTGLLCGDKSKEVRMGVVLALPLDTATLPVLLHRARDVSPQVRKALAVRLGGLQVTMLSILQRATILQQLLQDRDASVADAGRTMLALWLDRDCGGDPLQLLQLLDVETYTDAAVCALESLISSDKLQPHGQQQQQQQAAGCQSGVIAYVRAATAAGGGSSGGCGLPGLRALCRQRDRLLQPHEALMWRCLCEWLQTDAVSRGLQAAATAGARAAVQAAVAAERHEALEAVLPDTADELMGLIMRHTAAGPAARFAAAQLLVVAAKCMEWADVASRDSAAPFLQQLVSLDPTRESDPAAAHTLGCSGSADNGSGSDAEGADDLPGLQLQGNGGDGMFEGAVAQLVAAMQGSSGGFLAAMLEGISDLAAAAGLLRKPSAAEAAAGDGDGAGVERHGAFTVGLADSSQVLQVLCYTRMMLQRLPTRQQALPTSTYGPCGAVSFEALWELLLLLALKSEHTLVRAKAVECVGLYALAAAGPNPGLLTAAVALLGPLLSAEGSQLVRAAAVHALADIALMYGPAAVDAVLRRPGAADAAAAAAAGAGFSWAGADESVCGGGGAEQDSAEAGMIGNGNSSSSGGSKGLLELLLGQVQALLVEAQGGAAAAKKGGRPSAKAKADDCSLSAPAAELMAAVAEALAKLLLHQRAWLNRYPQHHTAAAAASVAAAAPAAGQVAGGPASAVDAAAAVLPVPLPPDSRQQQELLLRGALALLLQLQFHPATAGLTQVCQCLCVFFEVFGGADEAHRLQLASALLPAARQALHVKAKRQPAPLLAKYVLQLLQQARLREEQEGAAAVAQQGQLGGRWASVAHMLLVEVTDVWPFTVGAGKQPALFKPYLSTLIKVIFELPLSPEPQDVAALQCMTNNLSVLLSCSSRQDAGLAKDVAALQQHLQALAESAGLAADTLGEDDLQTLIQQIRKLSLQQLPALPDDITVAAAGGVDSAAAVMGAGRGSRASAAAAGAKTPAVRGRGRGQLSAAARKRAAASSDDEDSSSSSSSGAESDASSDSDDGDDDGAQQDAPVAAVRRASSSTAAAAAAAASRRRSSAAAGADAAAAAGDIDDSYDSSEEAEGSESFATAEGSDSGDAEDDAAEGAASTGRRRRSSASHAAAAVRGTVAAARAAGAVSELSDSEEEEEDSGSDGADDDGDESSGSDQE